MLWLYYKYRLPIFILSNAETIWMQPGKYLKYKLVEKMRKRSVSGSGCIWYCSHLIQSLTWKNVHFIITRHIVLCCPLSSDEVISYAGCRDHLRTTSHQHHTPSLHFPFSFHRDQKLMMHWLSANYQILNGLSSIQQSMFVSAIGQRPRPELIKYFGRPVIPTCWMIDFRWNCEWLSKVGWMYHQ